MMNRLLTCLFLAGAVLPAGAMAQSRETLAGAARAFDESDLRRDDDNDKPMPVRKWTAPARLGFANPSAAPNLIELSKHGVRTIAAEAGIAVIAVENAASTNYLVHFDENGVNGKAGYCFARAWWDKDRVIYRGELRINPMRLHDSDRCAVHEAIHSFGFLSPSHAAMSVLSYVQDGQRSLTPLDQQLIRTLYDDRLVVGLPHPGRTDGWCYDRHRRGVPRPQGGNAVDLGAYSKT